jgi:ribosomal protein L40E
MMEAVECSKCGTRNPPELANCRMCGAMLRHRHEVPEGGIVCETCGAEVGKGDELCNSCRTPVRKILMSNLPGDIPAEECVHWSERPAAASRAATLYVAGILILIGGVLGIAQSVLGLTPDLGESFLQAYEDLVPGAGAANDLVGEYVLLQLAVFVFGCAAIFCSLFAFDRSNYRVALVGGVCGFLAIGLLIGSFLSLVGLMLIVASRRRFLSECG